MVFGSLAWALQRLYLGHETGMEGTRAQARKSRHATAVRLGLHSWYAVCGRFELAFTVLAVIPGRSFTRLEPYYFKGAFHGTRLGSYTI